ncbi:MAG TPA: EAL domain-containing protein [Gemmatimonadales bacterium]|nr:EAL domain-containing protein [Gemmatimonadales bacterium]
MIERSDGASQQTARPGPTIWAVACAGLAFLGFYTAGLFFAGDGAYARFQSDILYPVAPLAALALVCVPLRRRQDARTRLGWWALGAGALAWLLGDLSYSYHDLRFGTDPPFPGSTDAIYAAGYIGFALAVVLLAFPSWKMRDWRWIVDAGVVLVVGAAAGWAYLLEPVARAGYSTTELLVALAYPVGDLVLLSLVVLGWYANGGRMTKSVGIIAAAIAAFAIADAGYTYMVSTTGYDNVANPLDPVWMAGYLLVGIGALLPHGSLPAARREANPSLLGIALPYAILVVLSAATLTSHFVLGYDTALLTTATIVTAMLVVVRQFGTLRQNLRLLRDLATRSAELEASSRALKTAQERLTTVVSNSPIVLFSVDREGVFTLSEGAGLKQLGLAPGQVVGQSVWDVYRDVPRIGANIRRGLDGEEIDDVVDLGGLAFATHYAPLRDASGTVIGVTGVATDVSERERFQQQLIELANVDTLTGLLNRRRMNEEVESALAEWRDDGTEAALLFLDLDQFKDVNDAYGHRTGDELLVQVARELRGFVRGGGAVSRFGGDEFAILLRQTSPERAQRFAEALVDRLASREFIIGGIRISASISIGIATVGRDGATVSDLMARADAAMYRAKEAGRNRAFAYEPGVDNGAEVRSGWLQRIRRALSQDRFVLHAQPIVDLASRRVVAHELLLRMVDTDGLLIPPAAFLGFAERSGLVVEIDRWVVAQALDLMGQVSGQGQRLSVNVSGQSLTDRGILSLLERGRDAGRLPPGSLTIEITETAAVQDLDAALAFTSAARDLGCNVALDDFGVGFSSFAQLKRLNANLVKIDGTFVRNLATDPVDRQLVRSMTQLAHALDKQVVAEFVSDAASVEWLRSCNVDFGQGHYFGAPVAIETVTALAA